MALRTFVSRDGTEWNVWNVVPTLMHNDRKVSLSIGMSQGWLCFESHGVKRRIVPVPPGWEDWSDDELDTALAESQVVERRLPPDLPLGAEPHA